MTNATTHTHTYTQIMDGHNILDFVDPDIDAKLAELEREEVSEAAWWRGGVVGWLWWGGDGGGGGGGGWRRRMRLWGRRVLQQ
mgnify:CR=1 FL=1